MQKIVFFFPWKIVSGGPFYLTRLANDLAKLKEYEVYYTDYIGGLCTTLITEKSIKILAFNDEENFPVFPEEPVILIIAEYWANVMPKLHPESKIVFFNWHNECIPVLQRDWGATDGFIKKFLQLVSQTDSVFFLDKTHWMKQCEYGVPFKEKYVPIAIPSRNVTAKKELISSKERNIAVLGRLVVDKVYSVTDLINNIIALRDNIQTNIYIIGEGDYEYLVFNRDLPSYVNVIRCGTLKIDKVIKLLSNKVDILFAMGTSVLEGATIKIPCVVVPNDMKPFECNRYPYLYESKGFALGWYPRQIDKMDIRVHTIEEIFTDIYHDHKKEKIGYKCFNYYEKNHKNNITYLLSAINSSTLTYARWNEFLRHNINWKQLLWKVRRKLLGDIIKQLRIFGFPIYIRSATNGYHYNVFVFCIPFLRITHFNKSYSVHLLPAVWIYRALEKGFKIIGDKKNEEESTL